MFGYFMNAQHQINRVVDSWFNFSRVVYLCVRIPISTYRIVFGPLPPPCRGKQYLYKMFRSCAVETPAMVLWFFMKSRHQITKLVKFWLNFNNIRCLLFFYNAWTHYESKPNPRPTPIQLHQQITTTKNRAWGARRYGVELIFV